MAKPNNNECVSCEAMFTVKHTMDDNYYIVKCCPFCGDELEFEETMDYDYDEEIEQ